MIERTVVVLPMPFAAKQGNGFPAPYFEIDLEQHLLRP